MVDRSLEPAASAYDSMILGLSEQGNVAEGMQWLDTMLKSRLKPQKKTFERLVQYLSEADRLSDALFVLDYMLKGCYVGDNGLAVVGKYFTQFEDLNMQFCKVSLM
ncbi:pentatricopeptide repeat-containing protein [Forsythia ovata]|uniref:Pentatricopeptide repeat-containing protein n=1 Tax=Forsythia ovata TaxID=205694 RepID=A0ABD1V062_9LAMI